MKGPLLLIAAFLLSVAGCALPRLGGESYAAAPIADAASTDRGALPPPIVQVRGFWRSSVVSVVAWDDDDAEFGLRTSVTRTGKLVGGLRFGDHVLYMTPLYARNMGGFNYAVATQGQPLLGVGTQRDLYACFYGRSCSPMVTVGVRVPDALLRSAQDSLVVTFYPSVLEPWNITLRKELVAAYLSTVDSVAAELTKKETT